MGITEEPILILEEVKKEFSSQKTRIVALDGLSFSVQKNEFVSLLGPSGCGKSTALRLIAGLDLPTSGSVRVGGEEVIGPDRSRGLVFQSYNVFPWLTVKENIGFGLMGLPEEAREEKVNQWLSNTQLSHFADAYPKALSGGMRQRVALARTMIVEPRLLLLDEPLGSLDEPIRSRLHGLLLEVISASLCSVIFVTHSIQESLLLSDRILLFSSRPGRVLESFTLTFPKPRQKEFIASYEFSDLYRRILDRFPSHEEFEFL